MRPAKAQTSIRICTAWSEPSLVAWIFYDDGISFGVSKLKRRLHRLLLSPSTLVKIPRWKAHVAAHLSRDMRLPTMWYVRPAKPQISLSFNILWVATDWTSFGVSKFNWGLHRLVWVHTCQNTTLLEITCCSSFVTLCLETWYMQNFNILSCLCSWAGWFELCLAANPKDSLSHKDAHIVLFWLEVLLQTLSASLYQSFHCLLIFRYRNKILQ